MEWWRMTSLDREGEPTDIVVYYCFDGQTSWEWNQADGRMVAPVNHEEDEPWRPDEWTTRRNRWEPCADPRDTRLLVEEGCDLRRDGRDCPPRGQTGPHVHRSAHIR